MVKRILALSLLMVAGLVGCGGQEDDVAELSMWSDVNDISDRLVENCENNNGHLDALVSKLKKVHEAITVTPDTSVIFDFSVSDSAIVKVEHSSISWKFTALKAGTTSITLVRTTPGIQTCSYTQAINISE